MKLTKRTVEAMVPKGQEYFLWDDQLPGFGCRIFQSRKRSYLVQYRKAGRTRRVKIGLHGPLTAEEARTKALELLGEIAKGGNPAEVREKERKAITVKELCRRYLEAAEKGLIVGKRRYRPKKASTLATDRGRIERHIVPLLGNRRIIDVTTSDVVRFMRDVAAGKTAVDIRRRKGPAGNDGGGDAPSKPKPAAAGKVVYSETIRPRGRAIVKGGWGTAMRTTGLLGGIFRYAKSEGLRHDNPVHGIDPQEKRAYRKRKMVLTPGQYRSLGDTLERALQRGENAKAVGQVWLIALTGCRRDEVAKLRREEVDKDRHCFQLEDSKEDESIRPVGKAAFQVLAEFRSDGNSEYVFPGDQSHEHYTGLPKAWRRIRILAEKPTEKPDPARPSPCLWQRCQ